MSACNPAGAASFNVLSSHTRELSAACGNMIAAAGGGAKLRAACGQDVQRFCVGVQPGGGRLVQCLSSHTREVSAACGNMIAATHARRGTPNPSVQSPAAQPAAPVTVGKPAATMGSILRASCGPDAQRLCAGARTESVVLKCLNSQRWNYRQLAARISRNWARQRKRIFRTKSRRRRHQPRPRPRLRAMTTHPKQVPANQ